MTKAIPARRTRLINAVLWDHVMIPQEHAIEGPCRSDKLCPILGEYHPVDQRVDRGILNPDIITRSQCIGSLRAPVVALLIARRQRLRPDSDNDVEVPVAQPIQHPAK